MANKPPLTRRASSSLKSAAQLIADSTRSVVSEIMPNMSNTIGSGMDEAGKAVNSALSRTRSLMNRQASTIDRTSLGRNISSTFNKAGTRINMAEYDQKRMASELGAYANSFDEDTFDEGNDGKENFSAGYGANEQIRALSSMNSTIANTASATINGMSSMTSTLANVQLESSKALAATVKNMSISQTNVLSSGLNSIAKQIEISNRYNAAMLEFMNKNVSPSNANMMDAMTVVGQKLDQLIGVLGGGGNGRSIARNPRQSSSAMDRIYSDGSGIDLNAYKKMIKEGFMTTELGMGYQLFSGLKNTFKGSMRRNGGGGIHTALAPQLANFLMSTFIGSNTKSRLAEIDKDLSEMLRHTLYNVGDMADKPGSNMFQRMIGQIFGVKRPSLSKIDLSRGRKDEVIGWNGIAQTALTEVIPNYLASIEKAVSGVRDKRTYDYHSGTFMTETEIMKSMLEKTYAMANDAFAESTTKIISGLQQNGLSQKDVDGLMSKINALIDSRISGERVNDTSFKNEMNGLLVRSGRMSDHDAFKAMNALETSIERMTLALSDFHNRVSEGSTDSMIYRNLFNRFDSSSKHRSEYETLAKRYINPGFFNETLLGMGGYSPSIHDALAESVYGAVKGGTKAKISASRELGTDIANMMEAISSHAHYRAYRGSGKASSVAAKNRSNDKLMRSVGDMRALDRHDPKSINDGIVGNIGDSITEGIESGNSTSILQSIAMSLHTNLLVPMYSNVFSKKGLLNKFFGDDPNSEFNKFKERLFGKEDGLLTPFVDYMKYQFTGKGYTSRSGRVYEDTDDNIGTMLKRGYKSAYTGSMTYLFGENYEAAEGYKMFRGLSPEAFTERKAKKAAYKKNLKVEARLHAEMNECRDRLINGEITQQEFLNLTQSVLKSSDLVATGDEGMVDRLNAKRNKLIDELGAYGYSFGNASVGNGRRRKSIGYGFSQNDPRWSNVPTGRFSNGTLATMATAGCGPTAMATIASLYGKKQNPADVLGFAQKNGYIVNGGATASLFTKGASKMGIKGKGTSLIDALKSLMKGSPAIFAGKGKGLYSKQGHIIPVIGSDGSNIVVVDPADGTISINPISALNGTTHAFSYEALGYAGSDEFDLDPNVLKKLQMSPEVINAMNAFSAAGIPINIPMKDLAKAINGKTPRKASTPSKPKAHVYDGILFDIKDVLNTINESLKESVTDIANEIDLSASILLDTMADEVKHIANISTHMSYLLEGFGIDSETGKVTSGETITVFNSYDNSTTVLGTNRSEAFESNINDTISKIDTMLERLASLDYGKNEVVGTHIDNAITDQVLRRVDMIAERMLIADYEKVFGGSTTSVNLGVNPEASGNDPYAEQKTLAELNEALVESITTNTANADEAIFDHQTVIATMAATGVIDSKTAKKLLQSIGNNGGTATRKDVMKFFGNHIQPKIDAHLSTTSGEFKLNATLHELQKKKLISPAMKVAVEEIHNAGADINRENLSAILAQAFAMNMTEIEANINSVGKAAIDDPAEFTQKFKQDMSKFNAKYKKLPGLLTKSGFIGALVGLANMGNTGLLTSMLLPGGPIGGAIAGMGIGLLSRNQKFMETVFGKDDGSGVRKDGLISAQLQQSFKKGLPYAVGGATIGLIKGLVTGALGIGGNGVLTGALLGTGPIGAAIVGLGLGILKNNETFNKTLFGTKGADNKRSGGFLSKTLNDITDAVKSTKEYSKNGLKGAGYGLLTGAVLSQIGLFGAATSVAGPIGAALAGLGIGIASTSDRFKEMMFGSEYVDGEGKTKRKKNGLLHRAMNMINDKAIYPLKDMMKDNMEDFAIWAKKNFEVPFKLAFGPIIDTFADFKQELKDTLHAAFEKISDGVTAILREGFDKLLAPAMTVIKKIGGGVMSGIKGSVQLAGGIASMPLKLMAMSQIKKRAKYEKDYKSSVLDIQTAKREVEEANGAYDGPFGGLKRGWNTFRDVFRIGSPDHDIDTALLFREAYGKGMEKEGKNHLGWFSARADYKKAKADSEARQKERRDFRQVSKIISKWKKDDRYSEAYDWTDELLLERQKELRKYGIKDFAIGSQEDIKRLMFHRDEWQKDYGEFGKQNLKVEEARAKEDAAQEATTEYQDNMTKLVQEITDYLHGRGQSTAADDSLVKREKFQQAQYERDLKYAKDAGVNIKDLRKINDDTISDPRFDDEIVEEMEFAQAAHVHKDIKDVLTNKIIDNFGKKKVTSGNKIDFVKTIDNIRSEIGDDVANAMISAGLSSSDHENLTSDNFLEKLKQIIFEAGVDVSEQEAEAEAERAEKAAEKAKEVKETEFNQSGTINADPEIYGSLFTKKNGELNWVGKQANKIKNSWLGQLFSGVKNFGAFVADSPMAQIALGVGAFLFRDQIGTVIGAIGGGIKDVFQKYLPTALDYIGNTVFPFIYENVGNVVAFAVKTLPGIVWEGLKGLGRGLADLGTDVWHWMGFGKKNTSYATSDVNLGTGMTNDGQYLAIDPTTGEYIVDRNGNYQVLGDYQYINEDGTINNINRGTVGKIGRAGFNMIRNPRNAITALNLAGGTTRAISNIPIVRKLPGFKTVFGATDRMGKGMMTSAKNMKATLKTYPKGTLIDYLGEASTRQADKIANEAMSHEVDKISKAFHKANKHTGSEAMGSFAENAVVEARERLTKKGAELGVDATKYIDDASSAIMKNADNLLEDSARRNADTWIKKMLSGMKKSKAVLSKSADSTLLGKLFGLLDNLSKGFMTKASNKILTKFASSCAEGILKGASRLVPVIGWAFTAYDAIKGFCDTEYLFGIPEGEADGFMRTISTIMNTLLGLGVGPIFDILLIVYSSITGEDMKRKFAIDLYESWMEAAGNESALEEFHESQEIMEYELAMYNADHKGGELTMNEYLELKKDSNSIVNKIKRSLGLKATEDLSKYEKGKAGANNTYYKDYVYNLYVLGDNGSTVEGNGRGAVGYGTYSQADPRWGNFTLGRFSNGKAATMDLAGCGPTALANVASQIGSGAVSPIQVARMAKRDGYISDGGANAGLFEQGARSLGLSSRRIDKQDISNHLRYGEKVIIAGKSNSIGYGGGTPFTPAGHIVTLEGGVGDSVLLSDPQTGRTSFYKMSSLSPYITNAWAIGGNNGYGYRGGKIRSSLGFGSVNFSTNPNFSPYTYEEAEEYFNVLMHGLSSDWDKLYQSSASAQAWYFDTQNYRLIDDESLASYLEECYNVKPSKFTSGNNIAEAMDNYWNSKSESERSGIFNSWAWYTSTRALQNSDMFVNHIQSLDPEHQKLAAAYLEFKIMHEYAKKNDPSFWTDERLLEVHRAHGFMSIGRDSNSNYEEEVEQFFTEKAIEASPIVKSNIPYIIKHLNKNGWDKYGSYVEYTNADGEKSNITVNELIELANTDAYPESKALDSWLYRLMYSIYNPYSISNILSNSSTYSNHEASNLAEVGALPIMNDKFGPMVQIISSAHDLGEIMGYTNGNLTNSYLSGDKLYGTVNGLPYFSMHDPKWSGRVIHGASFNQSGSEIAALATILTAYNLSSGDNTVFDPNFIMDYWMTGEKLGLWHSNSGILDNFYTRNGMQGLEEAFINGSPMRISSLSNIEDIMAAMELGKLVMLQGTNSKLFPNHNRAPRTVIGTNAYGNVFTVMDPKNHTINFLPKHALYDDNIRATLFETGDGQGINQSVVNSYIGSNSGSRLKSVWENIKEGATDMFGPISSIFSGIVQIFKNMISSTLGGSEYKSIHEIEYSADSESLGLADQQLLNNYNYLNSAFAKKIINVANPDLANFLKYKQSGIKDMQSAPIVPTNFPFTTSGSVISSGSGGRASNMMGGNRFSHNITAVAYGPALGYGRGGEDDEFDLSTLEGVLGKAASIVGGAISSVIGGSSKSSGYNSSLIDGKSAAGLVEFAKKMKKLGCRYLWGGSCMKLTESYMKSLRSSFAEDGTGHSNAKYIETYEKYGGSYVSDCSGLLRGYTGIASLTANSLMGTSFRSGSTKNMSSELKSVPGLLVFIQNREGKMTHVGIMMGDGRVIHTDKNHPAEDSDIVIETFSANKWTHWGYSKYLNYETSPATGYGRGSKKKHAIYETPSIGYGNAVSYLTNTLGGRITQRVGLGIDPSTGKLIRHRGTDIAAGYGAPIHSPVSGKVVENRAAGFGSDYGNYVVVQDNSGRKHLIAHMNNQSGYSVGSKVSTGDVIGNVGSTGKSTGPHVHYEVREKGHILDPLTGRSSSNLNIIESKLDSNMKHSSPVGGQNDVVALANVLGSNGDAKISDVVDGLNVIVDILTTWASADSDAKNKILSAVDEVKKSNITLNDNRNTNHTNNTSVNSPYNSNGEVLSNGGRALHDLIAKKGR